MQTWIASDGADKTSTDASVSRTRGTAEASGTAGKDPTDTVWVVAMAMHTAGPTGSQPTQLTGPSQPPVQPATQAGRNGESSARATKTLPVQPTVSAHDGITALPSVPVPMMAGCQNPSSTAVPSTGVDLQYGPSDQTEQFGNNTMQDV